MVLLNKKEFNSLVKIYQEVIQENGFRVSTARLREIIASSFGFKTSNGLIHAVPCKLSFEDSEELLVLSLQKKHGVEIEDITHFFHRIKHRYHLELERKVLSHNSIRVDYSYLANYGESPLVKKGRGSMKEAMAFLVLLPEERTIFPYIIDDLGSLNDRNGDLTPRFLLPKKVSFDKLHTFLNTVDVLENIERIIVGQIIIAEPNKLRVGKLNHDASLAKEKLTELIEQRLGKPDNHIVIA